MKESSHSRINVHSQFGLGSLLEQRNQEVVVSVELMLIVTLDRPVLKLDQSDNASGKILNQLMEITSLKQETLIQFTFQSMMKIISSGLELFLGELVAQEVQ